MDQLEILLGQSFSHMVGSEEQAEKVVERYKEEYTVKKSIIDKKTKKGVEFWIVKVEVEHVSQGEAFETYFDEV